MEHEKIMPANLERVFGEHDPSRRIEAIRELYAQDAELHEPQQSVREDDQVVPIAAAAFLLCSAWIWRRKNAVARTADYA